MFESELVISFWRFYSQNWVITVITLMSGDLHVEFMCSLVIDPFGELW